MTPINNRIVLIHGILNHHTWLWPLSLKMKRQNFDVHIFSYNSVWGGPQEAMPRLIDMIERVQPMGLIGHSLGGLLALETLDQRDDLNVEKVVCLGSPLKGSMVARHCANHWALQKVLGHSEQMLTRGRSAWTGQAHVGVVAGDKPRGLGQLVAPMNGHPLHDGTVLMEETQLDGISAHTVVHCGHTELAFHPEAAKHAGHFLRHGHFDDRDK